MTQNSQLKKVLEASFRRRHRLALWCKLGSCWTGAAAVGLGLVVLERQTGWTSWLTLPLVALLGIVAASVVALRHLQQRPDWHRLARQIEALHPELEGRVITAVQQESPKGGEFNYLQRRLIDEALHHNQQRDWSAAVPRSRLMFAQAAHWLALMLFLITLLGLRETSGTALLAKNFSSDVNVTPGDAQIERGGALVVLARFAGTLPASVHLVAERSAAITRIPLVKSLGDPMFGGSLPDISSNLVYHIEYSGDRTRDFHVTVFEHPRLERADVTVRPPAYTGLPSKRIEDTLRVSAVEGSQLDLSLKLNKPVASARLVSKAKGEKPVPLTVNPGEAAATLPQLQLDSNQTYDLQLVDAEGRTNKVSSQFVFEALRNRTPELRLSSPKGDLRPSALEEISFEGTVWDDFGVPAFGLGYMMGGREPQFIELGRDIAAQEKHAFHHLLRLEELAVQPDQAISWFVWADDIGPDGKIRRTAGDLFFGEVRPFDEVFREGQGMEGQSANGEQGGGADRVAKLADLQKQIISATWKLQRDSGATGSNKAKEPRNHDSSKLERLRTERFVLGANADVMPGPCSPTQPQDCKSATDLRSFVSAQPLTHFFGQVATDSDQDSQVEHIKPTTKSKTTPVPGFSIQDDIGVVHDSELQALEQANAALRNQRDPRSAALWREAIKNMEDAIARLKTASKSPALLKEALAAEQSSYQTLLKLQAHEYQVARSRNRSQGSSRNDQMQQQLEQLDLTQSENRYETQREAQRPQSARREQLQVMNRLQELARRQQDLNDRLKELQTALQEARTEDEKAEIRRRLKRLQEEERQMLADVDELRQRMDRPENQSQMADQRRQLDQTREDVQHAAEAAGQDAASQALAAGTRAQRQLQQMRDQMRKENSSQFAEDMRGMRNQARELARQQEDILKKMQEESATERKSLSDEGERQQTLEKVARQNQLTTNLLQRATQVSQQAESSEPLLANQLYDTVRKFAQQSSKDVKQTTDELLNRGLMTRSLYERLRDTTAQDSTKMHDVTSEMFKQGNLPEAAQVAERARAGINSLKEGVEHAAESVLGDDTEALRLAQQELNQLTEDLQREMGRERAQNGSTNAHSALSAESNSDQADTNGMTNAKSRKQGQQVAQAGAEPGRAQAGTQSQQTKTAQSPEGTAQSGQTANQKNNTAGRNESASDQNPSVNPDQAQNSESNQAEPGSQAGKGEARQTAQANGNGATGRRPRQPGELRGGEPADGAAAGGGGAPRDWNLDRLLRNDVWQQAGPLTGEDFVSWSDRLREVEEMLDAPDLRNEVATARERARVARQEFKRDGKKPDWAVVQLQVMKPLAEVRDLIAEELARRQSRDALVPIDRDPVPNRYSDLVRRYYEELGKSK